MFTISKSLDASKDFSYGVNKDYLTGNIKFVLHANIDSHSKR